MISESSSGTSASATARLPGLVACRYAVLVEMAPDRARAFRARRRSAACRRCRRRAWRRAATCLPSRRSRCTPRVRIVDFISSTMAMRPPFLFGMRRWEMKQRKLTRRAGRAPNLLVAHFERADDAVECLRGVVGVQRRKHQVAGFHEGQRDHDALDVAHLADQHDVRGLRGVPHGSARLGNDCVSTPTSR